MPHMLFTRINIINGTFDFLRFFFVKIDSALHNAPWSCAKNPLILIVLAMSNTKKKTAEDEDVVSTAIGEFGRWQLLMTFLLSLFNIPCTWHIFVPTFHAAERDMWCARTEGFMDVEPSLWKNYTQPEGLCKIYDLTGITQDDLPYLAAKNKELVSCTEWEFEGEGNF